MIKISVIIPVYNRERYIKECLDSVLSQTLKEIEIICVNDGSTDSSYDILMEYGNRYTNITVLHQENQGAGPARNRGIEYAKGKYICFIDSDDYYARDCVLEHLYLSAEANHVSVCGGNLALIWQNGEIQKTSNWFYEKKMLSFRELGFSFNYTAYIYSLKLIKDNNIKFPTYKRFQDPPFFLKVMACARNFFAIDELIYIYRHGHKELECSLDMAIDILRGIRDCFEIAKDNQFVKMYNEYFKNILCTYLWIIYPYVDQGQVWELISIINSISVEWQGEFPKIFQNKEKLKAYVAEQIEKRNHILYECRIADEVIIYGAGEVGKYFLKNYDKACRHIAGFAVSRKDKESYIDGYEVREIGEYSREALVVVAVGKNYIMEILENLKRLEFKNICCIDYTALRLIEKI